MGYTLYDDENNIIHNRPVAIAAKTDNEDIVVSPEIAEIVLDGTYHGFHGAFIVYGSAGSTRQFHCINCMSSSPTTELKSVYIDTVLDYQNLPDTANCLNSCRFRSGQLTDYYEPTQPFSPSLGLQGHATKRKHL